MDRGAVDGASCHAVEHSKDVILSGTGFLYTGDRKDLGRVILSGARDPSASTPQGDTEDDTGAGAGASCYRLGILSTACPTPTPTFRCGITRRRNGRVSCSRGRWS